MDVKEATALKIEAEAKRADAERKVAEAEAEKVAVEGRKLLAEARQAEISLAKAQRAEEEELASNRYHQIYVFDQSVSDGSVTSCITRLTHWSRTCPGCPIEIIFTSPGGSVISGMALFDFIQGLRAKGHHITTTTLGMAASMAGILLQAGDIRRMGREAYVLIHEVSTMAVGKIGEIEDEVKFVKKIQKRVVDIFMSRCGGKISRKTFEKNWTRKDWWLDSAEAVKFGFVDEVC